MFNPYNNLYGNFTRRNFTEIFPDEETFINCPVEALKGAISEESMRKLYYLLYARYGSSTIAFDSEPQFIYSVFSTIFMYGPTWEKRLEIQKKIKELDLDNGLLEGAKYISNLSMNPSTIGASGKGNDDLAPLETVNQQSYNGWKKNKLQAYGEILEIMKTDVTERFIGQFKKLFITVVEPNLPLWFENED